MGTTPPAGAGCPDRIQPDFRFQNFRFQTTSPFAAPPSLLASPLQPFALNPGQPLHHDIELPAALIHTSSITMLQDPRVPQDPPVPGDPHATVWLQQPSDCWGAPCPPKQDSLCTPPCTRNAACNVQRVCAHLHLAPRSCTCSVLRVHLPSICVWKCLAAQHPVHVPACTSTHTYAPIAVQHAACTAVGNTHRCKGSAPRGPQASPPCLLGWQCCWGDPTPRVPVLGQRLAGRDGAGQSPSGASSLPPPLLYLSGRWGWPPATVTSGKGGCERDGSQRRQATAGLGATLGLSAPSGLRPLRGAPGTAWEGVLAPGSPLRAWRVLKERGAHRQPLSMSPSLLLLCPKLSHIPRAWGGPWEPPPFTQHPAPCWGGEGEGLQGQCLSAPTDPILTIPATSRV